MPMSVGAEIIVAALILAAPYLATLWPSARLIDCQRRSVEHVASQIRRFGNDPAHKVPFAEACQIWARWVGLWADVESRFPACPASGVFLIHPATEGSPISVTFRSLGFTGHNRFVVRPEIMHPQGQPIVSVMRRVNPADDGTVCEACHTVRVGSANSWIVDFPPLSGNHDACLSTEMVEGAPNAFYARAEWTTPRFLTA